MHILRNPLLSFVVLFCCLIGISSCSGKSPLAGGTSETGNARLAGTAVYPDGSPVAFASVRIRPRYYLPGDTAAGYDVTTDTGGNFDLSRVAPGEYLLEVADKKGSGAMLSLTIGSEHLSHDAAPVLHPHGGISGTLPEKGRVTGARIAIFGLERPEQITDSTGTFAFTDLPEGAHSLQVTYGDTLLGTDTIAQQVLSDMLSYLSPDSFPAARTKLWTAAGGDFLASNPDNWEPSGVPGESSHVRLALGDIDSLNWDLSTGCASWTQTEAFTGTVIFQTRYDGTPVHVRGNILIAGGSWTHRANDSLQAWRLWVRSGGDFVVGSSATIAADGKGFANSFGPGAPTSGDNDGAAHGGLGGDGCWQGYDGTNDALTYGSETNPTDLGSASDGGRGGGAILVEATGVLHIEGSLTANGSTAREHDAGGAGGSIQLSALSLSGNGTFQADGGNGDNCAGGGGGRIALHLSADVPFSFWSGKISANGGEALNADHERHDGEAGTIYLETSDAPGRSTLITTGILEGAPW